jgi:signal transduction histidine kinase
LVTESSHLPELRLLGDLSRALAQGATASALVGIGLQRMAEILEAKYCAVVLQQEHGHSRIEDLWVRGRTEAEQNELLDKARSMIASLQMQPADPLPDTLPQGLILVEDVREFTGDAAEIAQALGETWGFRSFLGASLVESGKTRGHVYVIYEEPKVFPPRDTLLTTMLADQLVAALRMSRQRAFSDQVIRQLPAMMALLDGDRRLSWVSPQVTAWFGKDEFELLGQPVLELLATVTDLDLTQRRVPEGPLRIEALPMRLPHWQDGQTSYWDLVIEPVGSDSDNAGTLLLAIEVTERAERVRRDQEHQARQHQLDRLRDDFVSAASHELHTPLASIIGHAELLEDGLEGPLNTRQLDFLREIQLGANRLQRLVDDLLDYAKLEAGTFSLSPREVDLAELVRQAGSSLWPQLQDAGVRLVVPDTATMLEVLCDPQRITQVLVNLISNAIRFTPKHGEIRVTLATGPGCVTVSVADTGVGIEEADLNRVFEKYFQGARRSVGARRGSGLGLYVARALVEAHGGKMGVTSAPDQGATFWFDLPLGPQS